MMKKKFVPVEKFMEVALANGYEVFDEAQVAAYAKDSMMKSQAGLLSKSEADEFAVEMAGLQKAICANEDSSQCTLYYRKPLVDWKVDSNGLVMKGIAGTYTDTPENRKLNRVGQAYVASPDVIKSIYSDNDNEGIRDVEMSNKAASIRKSCAVVVSDADRRFAAGEISEELCKSVRTEVGMYLTSWGDTLDECCDVVKSEDLADVREDLADATAAFADIVKAAHGRYADNAKNRRLHRVGQEYGKAGQKEDKDGKKQGAADGESGEKQSRNGDSVKRDISILEENKDKIVEKYGQEAYDKKIEALKKEGEDFEQKETVKQLKERADKQDAEEEERKKAEKRAKRQERRRARHAAKKEEAKKAKAEAEAKAKAEAEEKEKQAAEEKEKQAAEEKKNEEPSAEEIAEKVKQFPKGWQRKANGDDSDQWAAVLEDKMSPEEFDALYDESKPMKQWKKDWTDAIAKYLSVDEVMELMGKAKGPTYIDRQVASWKAKVDEAKTPDEALDTAMEAFKAFTNDKRVGKYRFNALEDLVYKNPKFESFRFNEDIPPFKEEDVALSPYAVVDKYVSSVVDGGASPKEAKAYVKRLLSEMKTVPPDRYDRWMTPSEAFDHTNYPDSLSVWVNKHKGEQEWLLEHGVIQKVDFHHLRDEA